MELEIFEVAPDQWGFRGVGILQEWHPEKAGFVAMTKEEAIEQADIIVSRLA